MEARVVQEATAAQHPVTAVMVAPGVMVVSVVPGALVRRGLVRAPSSTAVSVAMVALAPMVVLVDPVVLQARRRLAVSRGRSGLMEMVVLVVLVALVVLVG